MHWAKIIVHKNYSNATRTPPGPCILVSLYPCVLVFFLCVVDSGRCLCFKNRPPQGKLSFDENKFSDSKMQGVPCPLKIYVFLFCFTRLDSVKFPEEE